MARLERYAATAYLEGSANRRLMLDPSDLHPLLAQSPLGAARIFYWRLVEQERLACLWIAVSAWAEPGPNYFPTYAGPSMAFSPVHGWSRVEHDNIADLITT